MTRNPWFVIGAIACVVLSGCGKNAPQYIKRGNELYAAGKYNDAVLNYRNALKKEPKSSEAHYRLALTLLKIDQGLEAYQELGTAIALDPHNSAAKASLGKLAIAVYQAGPRPPAVLYNQARTMSDQLLADNSNSVDGLQIKGALALIDKHPADAVAIFSRGLQVAPDSAELQTSLAEALLKNNQIADGERQAKLAIEHHPDYTPAYDLLYTLYSSQQRFADAESLLKTRRLKNPSDASAVVSLAAFYYQTKKPQDSELIIQSLRDRRGVFPQADLIIGDFHSLSGNWQQALADYQRGASADKVRETTYQERIARVLAILGRRDESLKTAEAILAKDPHNVAARAIKIQVLNTMPAPESRKTAATIAKDLARDAPADARVQMIAGQAFLAAGNVDEAEKRFYQAAADDGASSASPWLALAEVNMMRKNYARALDYSNNALTVKPGDETARMLHIAALTATGSYAAAKTEAQQLSGSASAQRSAQTQLAVLALLQKRYADAEATFRKLYQEDNSNVSALAGLVQTYQAENQPNRALDLMQSESKRLGGSVRAESLLVDAAEQAGNGDLAMAELRKMAAQNPNSVDIQVRVADEERARGNLAAALSAYQHVRQLDPKHKDLEKVMGTVQQDMGDTAGAIASYRKAIEDQPDDLSAANNLAFLLADSGGDLNEALQLATNALRKSPTSPAIQDTLAWIDIKKGNAGAALPILTSLTRKYPDVMVVRYHYAVALLQSGNRQLAKQQFETVLAKNPPKTVAASIRGFLAEAQ